MDEFRVFAGDVLVGWSKLEHGDPPMGVVSGWVSVTPSYDTIAKAILYHSAQVFGVGALRRTDEVSEALIRIPAIRVLTPDGESLESSSIVILDYSTEPGHYQPEVQVLGVPNDTYRRLFAHHWKAYELRSPSP